MAYSFKIEATDEDLVALKSAHQRITRHLGAQAFPLDMLALIALRSLDPDLLATEVLVAVAATPAEPAKPKRRAS